MSQAMQPSLLSAGISKHTGLKLKEQEYQYRKFFNVASTDRRFIDTVGMIDMPLPQSRNIGGPVFMSGIVDDFNYRYIVANFGLGLAVAQEDMDDDMYGMLRWAASAGGSIGRKFRLLYEKQAFGYLAALGFTAGTTLATSDGVALMSTAHPTSRVNTGTTQSNRPSVEVNLSYSSLQAGIINLINVLEADGVTAHQDTPRALLVNPVNHWVARQVLRLEWEYGTANRNENLLKDVQIQLVESPYFQISGATGTNNAWILEGQRHGLNWYMRQPFRLDDDKSIGTNSHVFIGTCRFAVGCDPGGWRSLYGSTGT